MKNILDITLLEADQKKITLFSKFDSIKIGEDLVIQYDHDPKPLYHQLLGEKGNVFTWEYLEDGPERWKVRLLKKQMSDRHETLGDLVAKDVRKAAVFKKYGLDFCCGGKRSLKEACEQKGVDLHIVEKELVDVKIHDTSRPLPYNEWKVDFLIDYIVNTHHSYVIKTLPDLRYYARKVSKVHGNIHPELIPVCNLVQEVYTEMESHMIKEEQILFPYIKQLVQASETVVSSGFGNIVNPINMMEMEHELVGSKMETINTLTDNYTAPSDACASYNVFYRLLKEFEEDLHTHVHLENNILFPKAIEREKQLIEKSALSH